MANFANSRTASARQSDEMKEERITPNTQPLRAYLSTQPDLIVAYLFGSVARGEARADSDLDLAVLFDDSVAPLDRVERQLALLLVLDQLTDDAVQITVLNNAAPLLRFEVIRDGILLHARSEAERIAFEVRVMQIYADLKPMVEFFNQVLLKRIEEDGLGRRQTDSSRTLETARRLHRRLEAASER